MSHSKTRAGCNPGPWYHGSIQLRPLLAGRLLCTRCIVGTKSRHKCIVIPRQCLEYACHNYALALGALLHRQHSVALPISQLPLSGSPSGSIGPPTVLGHTHHWHSGSHQSRVPVPRLGFGSVRTEPVTSTPFSGGFFYHFFPFFDARLFLCCSFVCAKGIPQYDAITAECGNPVDGMAQKNCTSLAARALLALLFSLSSSGHYAFVVSHPPSRSCIGLTWIDDPTVEMSRVPAPLCDTCN